MKTLLTALFCSAFITAAHGDFQTWTNKDGRSADLDLIEVAGADAEMTGTFKMRNGRTVKIKAADLTEEDGKRLNEWKPAASTTEEAAPAGAASVFDDVLDKNLLILDGKKLKKHELATKPAKYYVFYYTASWCGPCQAFTPSLVEFYNKHKEGNNNFELVLISSDREEDAMEDYAKEKKMPWPQLKLSKSASFKGKFNHGVSGIPSLIVCDLEGNNLGNFRSNLPGLEKLIK
jgi:nucleoredoxin